jgi:DNA-binding CsgD family transcriptional regulator
VINNYDLFFRLIETYLPGGFMNINPEDPIVRETGKMLESNNQFFYIGDLILFKMLFIHKRVYDMLGIEPETIAPGFFITTTHPEDQRRHHMARAKLITMGQEFYVKRDGKGFISFNVRTRKPGGGYYSMLYQFYFFYSNVPYETVFLMVVFTDISHFGKIPKGFHYYIGTDRSYFRYPDPELLAIGNIFSPSEFEILQLLEAGLTSEEIAQKLFRSVHTINTHRSNIIKKSGKSTTTEVILDLKEKGLL